MSGLSAHNQNAILFFSSLLLSLWLTPLAIRLSFRINAIDRPDGRKIHKKAISRMGGVSMVAGLCVPLLLFRGVDRPLAGFLAGAAVVVLTGFLDDLYRISARWKFLGEIAAAGLFLAVSGYRLEGFGDFLGVGPVRFGPLAAGVTVFCMVGVMNALNLSDGLDGLAGGIAVIACLFLGGFAYLAGDWVSLSILMALAGALFGFLRYNTHPANLFMGDTGSLLLGYSLSVVTVMLVQGGHPGEPLVPATVAAVLALPIMDTLLVMGRRVCKRMSPFEPDRTHLHHRLLALGLPHAAVVPLMYMSAALFGLQAWHLMERPEWVQFGAVLALGGVIYGALALVERNAIRWDRFLVRNGERRDRGLYPVLARLMGRSVRPAAWVIAVGLFLPTMALDAVPRPFTLAAAGAGLFAAVLFPWRSRRSRSGLCYGLMYACAVVLLGILQGTPGMPRWMPGYLAGFSALILLWVLLKMKYRGHRDIVLFSSFETLLIGASLFVPVVLAPALELGEGPRTLLLSVCLESVVLLLAMKLLVVHQPRRNPVIAATLLLALSIVAMKGFLGESVGPVDANADRPPAAVSASVPDREGPVRADAAAVPGATPDGLRTDAAASPAARPAAPLYSGNLPLRKTSAAVSAFPPSSASAR